MTLLGIAVLCALGAWQLHRLQWKEDMLRQLDVEFSKDASQIFLDADDFKDSAEFRRGSLRGEYDFKKQILIGPRTYKNLPGRHVYTPLRLEDGTHILVNRGWVPIDWKSEDEIPMTRESAQQEAHNGGIIGLLRRTWEGNPFTPDNDPAKDIWYTPDTEAIANAKDIKSLHNILFTLQGGETEGNYPIPVEARPDMPNNHLQYAFFWFALAVSLGIIYLLRFLVK